MDLSETIHFLGDLLGQVLLEQESQQLFEIEERIRSWAKARRSDDQAIAWKSAVALSAEVACLGVDDARVISSAFALYFDLVNSAEDNNRIDALRQEALARDPAPVHDSIEDAVALLKARGMTAEQMGELVDRLQIELVLTAHPTESRRRTILSKIQRIAGILRDLSRMQVLPKEMEQYRRQLLNEVATLWLTERARTSKPAVTDEVRTTLYFVGQVFWTALPQIYDLFQEALDRHYPGLRAHHPWLSLASWIGGDRDGNPNVTVEVTAETLRLHRGSGNRDLPPGLSGSLQAHQRERPPQSPAGGLERLAGLAPRASPAHPPDPPAVPGRALPPDPGAAGIRPG